MYYQRRSRKITAGQVLIVLLIGISVLFSIAMPLYLASLTLW